MTEPTKEQLSPTSEQPDQPVGELPGPDGPLRGPDGRFLPGVRQPGANIFKPGQSGNPTGRTSAHQLTRALIQAFEKDDGTLAEGLIRMAFKHAIAGKFSFFKEIYDRLEGKVPDRIAGPDGEAIKAYFGITPEEVCKRQEQSNR